MRERYPRRIRYNKKSLCVFARDRIATKPFDLLLRNSSALVFSQATRSYAQKLTMAPDKDCPQPRAPVNAVQRAGNANRNKTLNLKLAYLIVQCLRSKLNLVSAVLEKKQPDIICFRSTGYERKKFAPSQDIEGLSLASSFCRVTAKNGGVAIGYMQGIMRGAGRLTLRPEPQTTSMCSLAL